MEQTQELAIIMAQMVAEAVAPLYRELAELKPKADPRDGDVNLSDTKNHYGKKGAYDAK